MMEFNMYVSNPSLNPEKLGLSNANQVKMAWGLGTNVLAGLGRKSCIQVLIHFGLNGDFPVRLPPSEGGGG